MSYSLMPPMSRCVPEVNAGYASIYSSPLQPVLGDDASGEIDAVTDYPVHPRSCQELRKRAAPAQPEKRTDVSGQCNRLLVHACLDTPDRGHPD